jgi:hypothetical protein
LKKRAIWLGTNGLVGIAGFQRLGMLPDLVKPDIQVIRLRSADFESSAGESGDCDTFPIHQTCYGSVLSFPFLDIRCEHFRAMQLHLNVFFPFMQVVELHAE